MVGWIEGGKEEEGGRKERGESGRVAGVRACNSVKFESGQNLLPVSKIVTHTALVGFKWIDVWLVRASSSIPLNNTQE